MATNATVSRLSIAAGLAVVLGVYLLFCGFYLDRGALNADEGFYAVASRSVMEGRLPYRDFGYTQMPLLPYVNGTAMSVVGFGLRAQRIVNLCWGALALLGVVGALRGRWGSWEPGLIAGIAVAASPWWASYMTMGKSYAAAGAFLVACAAAYLGRGSLIARTAGVAVLGTLAAGCRLHLAVPVAVIVIGLILEARGPRSRWRVLAMCGGVPAVVLIPFFGAAPTAFVFFNWSYHLGSSFDRRGWVQLVEWGSLAPAALLLLVAGWIAAAVAGLVKHPRATTLLVAALLAVTTPMMPRSAYGDYIAPAVALAALAGVHALWTTSRLAASKVRHLLWLAPLLSLAFPAPPIIAEAPAASGRALGNYVIQRMTGTWRGWPDDVTASASIEGIGRFLREHVPPEGEVLTPIVIVAVESGHRLSPGTEMGMFSTLGPGQEARARALNLTTLPLLIERIQRRDPAAIVRMHDPTSWNFGLQVPSLRWQPLSLRRELYQALDLAYRPVFRAGPYDVLMPRPRVDRRDAHQQE